MNLRYVCACCGVFAVHEYDGLPIDSGMILRCADCGEGTVIDLDTLQQNAERRLAKKLLGWFRDMQIEIDQYTPQKAAHETPKP